MIGAMVREPMFQHYLMLGWDQTIGIRRNFDRAKRDVISKETIRNKKIRGKRQDAINIGSPHISRNYRIFRNLRSC